MEDLYLYINTVRGLTTQSSSWLRVFLQIDVSVRHGCINRALRCTSR